MPTYLQAREFAKPLPLHMLTDEAEMGREAMRQYGRDRFVDHAASRIVTKHGNPPRSRWEGDPVTRNARALLALAEASGFTAHLLVDEERCVVEGYRLRPAKVGFRASWLRGSAGGFAWCTPWRYELVEDARPVEVNKITRTGKEGSRSPGVGSQRLAITGTPWGLKVTWTDLQRRVRAAADAVAS